MKFFRRPRLVLVSLCLCVSGVAQQPPQQQPQVPPAKPPAAPKPANPFETIPQTPQQQAPPPAQPATPPAKPPATPPQQPQQTPLEPVRPAPPPAEAPKPAAIPDRLAGQPIEAITFQGARRVPQDTLKAMIVTRPGDLYSDESLRRDFMALWNTSRFDDIRLEIEQGQAGLVVRFVLTERRVIRSINYEGIKSVTVSEILDRFKERKVGLSTESQYDPDKIQRATVALKEFLSERGRQYASVDPQIEQIPPSSLKLTFNVNEGPKVKVGDIDIVGNKAYSDRVIIRSMKLLKPIGIPHSIFAEGLFPKTFDQNKLEYDKEMIRMMYSDRGYFTAKVLDEEVKIIPKGGRGWRLPLIKMNAPGIAADLTIPVEEGKLYHLRDSNFMGVKFFKEPSMLMTLFGMQRGDVFSTDKLRKGLENLRKLYGQFGFIDFVPEPTFDIDYQKGEVDLTLTADEGKQFFVRRIDFSGNTTTRDKVIRREILIDEGDLFNAQLWDVSILRLNQLGYFEMLKKEDAADLKRNPQTDTIDITLKVRERGKNSIGMNGGVSGIAGSFMGFNYSTNNFLGLGETLSIESQLGTRMRDVSFGFTEPYFLDRPLQLGFVVYLRSFNFDQGREASILYGRDVSSLYSGIDPQSRLNYSQNSRGFSLSASYPLRRSFARIGITYGYDISNVKTETNAATNYFQYINFSGVAGPNSLSGIKTSHIVPSYTYNTVNHPMSPTAGRSIFASFDFAGSILGGNVNTIRPTLDVKYFRPSPIKRSHILAFHFMGTAVTGYGGKYIPPYNRTFMGGEQDVRGFQIWGISPMAFMPSLSQVSVFNDNGTQRTQKAVSGGKIVDVPVTMQVPSYQFITPGGDMQLLGNFEYRISILGPVTLAPFIDAGLNKILRTNQLTIDAGRLGDLNKQFPQAGFDGRVKIVEGTQKPRISTGVELQVMLPVVNAPFRIYWAYNPYVVQQFLQPPIVADRSMFPNSATFTTAVVGTNSLPGIGQPLPFFEKKSQFRFTIGRTF
jgi:outer membrane protein insertion porin family